MSEPVFQQVLLKDPLSEETRKERRNLLGISALGIVMVKTGLIPTKISALGIEFSQADRYTLLNILAAINIYFLLAFAFYALSDYWNYKVDVFLAEVKYQVNKIEALKNLISNIKEQSKILQQSTDILQTTNKDLEQVNKDMESHIEELREALKNQKELEGEDRQQEFESRSSEIFLRKAGVDARQKVLKEREMETDAKEQELRYADTLVKKAISVASLRLIFDFIMPVGIGIYSIVTLFRRQ